MQFELFLIISTDCVVLLLSMLTKTMKLNNLTQENILSLFYF